MEHCSLIPQLLKFLRLTTLLTTSTCKHNQCACSVMSAMFFNYVVCKGLSRRRRCCTTEFYTAASQQHNVMSLKLCKPQIVSPCATSRLSILAEGRSSHNNFSYCLGPFIYNRRRQEGSCSLTKGLRVHLCRCSFELACSGILPFQDDMFFP